MNMTRVLPDTQLILAISSGILVDMRDAPA